VEDRRWLLDLQGFQTLNGARRRFGDLPDRSVRAQQLRKFYPLQIVLDVASAVGASLLGDALEEQREDGERDVGMDPVRRPVIDRTQLQAAL
jgi:hypothetical protein